MRIIIKKIIALFDVILGIKNRFGDRVVLARNARVQWRFLRITASNRLRIGRDSLIGAKILFEAGGGVITIGDRTFIGRSQIICHSRIQIGSEVLISWGVTIIDHDSHSLFWNHRVSDVLNWANGKKNWRVVQKSPVTIEDRVWIGFNAIILKGVTIGEGAVVGAGTVVTKNVPPFSIVAGNPARVVRELAEHER
jgi:galactoside O-acetyltransferase